MRLPIRPGNVGMLFITYDVSIISHIADEVIVLNKGNASVFSVSLVVVKVHWALLCAPC